jgi:hypothetical protein
MARMQCMRRQWYVDLLIFHRETRKKKERVQYKYNSFKNPGLQALTDASAAHRQCARENDALASDEGTSDCTYSKLRASICFGRWYKQPTQDILTMQTQTYRCGVAKTVSQMALKPNRDMSVRLVIVAIHPPLR